IHVGIESCEHDFELTRASPTLVRQQPACHAAISLNPQRSASRNRRRLRLITADRSRGARLNSAGRAPPGGRAACASTGLSAFCGRVERASAELADRGLTFELTGPWPPYCFTPSLPA